MKKLKDYIIVVEDAVTTALCDAVLTEYKQSDDWVSAGIKTDEDFDIRKCKTINVSSNLTIQKNTETRKNLDSYIFTSVSYAIKKYKENFLECQVKEDSGYELFKYEVNDYCAQRTDYFGVQSKTVSCSLALNDDYEGGEFAFFGRELVYKLKKGSCIMFPSNFMYPHEIMPVTSGTRYSIVTWFV
jgi:predicted 2-oxoglutarate/Fe(II)-dependent dioxygenase YbiX